MCEGAVCARPGGSVDSGVAGLGIDELERRICSVAGGLAAFTFQWLMLIAEFDRRRGWCGAGLRSCAHWLAWSCSLSPAAAREHVRIARALAALPLISAAFAAGGLSYSKVRAVTRIAGTVDEQVLLSQAQVQTAAQLERTVRGFRKSGGAGLAQQVARRARAYWDEQGMLVVSARLPADEGAVLMAALAAADAVIRADDPAVEDPAADAARRSEVHHRSHGVADALVVMAQAALASQPVDVSGEDQRLVVLHLDAAAVGVSGSAEPADVVRRIEEGPGVDRPTAERVACDALITSLVADATSGSLNAGRRTRKISSLLRRALRNRDDGCRFPGCHRRRVLEAHHIRHWLHGGPTDLDNLTMLCRFHHMALHEGGYTVRITEIHGDLLNLEFRRPDGRLLHPAPPLDSVEPDTAIPDVGTDTIKSGWRGERYSQAEAVDVLCRSSSVGVVMDHHPLARGDGGEVGDGHQRE